MLHGVHAALCCHCCVWSRWQRCNGEEESVPLTNADGTDMSSAVPLLQRRPSSLWESARSRLLAILAAEHAMGLANVHTDTIPNCLLHYEVRIELLPLLPRTLQNQSWRLLFSSQVHGCSLITLFERSHDRGPTLVVVCDKAGHTFGAFASESWRADPDSHYHGDGDSFLFTTWNGFRMWRWSGGNRYFQLATHDCLAFGGGGHFGLWLGKALGTGSTGACDTYGNEPLTEHRVRGGLDRPHAADSAFEVKEVQIWGFDP